MARAEWAARQSIHVADALAWALHVNGRDREALELSRQATRLGHRGGAAVAAPRRSSRRRSGMRAAAERHLRRALAVDPGVSPWQAAQARDALDRVRPMSRRPTLRRVARLLAPVLAAGALLALAAPAASAHPLGNFTVNRYTGLLVGPDGVSSTTSSTWPRSPPPSWASASTTSTRLADQECERAAEAAAPGRRRRPCR